MAETGTGVAWRHHAIADKLGVEQIMKVQHVSVAVLWLAHVPRGIAALDQVILKDASVTPRAPKNVAIIGIAHRVGLSWFFAKTSPGAGSAGSSTAYFLRKYSKQRDIPLNITVYERDGHIGGRSTTVGVYGDDQNPVELGASIFVEVNQNLVNAAREFNLSTSGIRELHSEGPALGIWNGREFVYTQASGGSWRDTAKLFWKYGLAPLKTVNLMKATVGKFLKMYEEPYFPWKSLSQVAYDLGLTDATAFTGEQFLEKNGIGKLFAQDIIQASTRVNYAQNLPLIHGLESMVCMATDGAQAIEGGNWQIFSHMLAAAEANVYLNRTVDKVSKLDESAYVISSKGTPIDSEQQVFDEVVLAGPYQYSNIDFDPEPRHLPDSIPYVQLHVTLFTSKHKLSPGAFNLPSDELVPQVVLTTLPPGEHHGNGAEGVGSPGFFSISLLRPSMDTRGNRDKLEYVYKVFSPMPLNETFIANILGLAKDESVSEEDVSWMYRKVWHSYPYEYPRVTFEELQLDDGLWYTAGIESFISTMETSSLMGKNIARLMVDGWKE
ncbi:putative prenylcysteine lyase [Aureobasidium subglaciale]|nr:putative prenylcysteine lyase [Aureobasidium subglaciale]KAI5224875.1 putative prenylcysteine lyase [Aureobasidium subglaciale]KAI5227891.1 putative prenylcysteine lyase [Aureobasidium subglaciale]KAI5263446.1 putative prenylcysteine lyase [Aureobasidium subglaciale]